MSLAQLPLIALMLLSEAAPRHAAAAKPGLAEGKRARIVATARSYVGKPVPGDCSSFVTRVYREAGAALPLAAGPRRSGTEAIFDGLTRVPRPRAGDVVVFHRTYDRERPGPGRNLFTHVGVVESVKGRRVTFIHRSGRRVERSSMNLARPRDPSENDVLRRKRRGDVPGQAYLAGELFAGYASPFAPKLRAGRRPAHR